MKKASMHGTSEHEGKAWGRGEHANMPKEVQMKDYPKNRGRSDSLDDTMKEIDRTISSSVATAQKRVSNQH